MTKKEFITIDTSKATKSDLLSALEGLPTSVKDENLLSRVKYALDKAKKSIKNVTVADLKDLITEAQGLLSAPAPAPVEASTKKPAIKGKKKPAPKDEPVDEDTDDETEDETPAPAPKKGNKSKTAQKGVKTAPQKVSKNGFLPVASMFPETVEFESDEGKQTLRRAHDKYHNTQEIRDALDSGEVTLFIAAYWTKRHIRQFGYVEQFALMEGANIPKVFPNDLDILNIVLACDTMERVFAMSTYTEAMYRFDKPDFEPVEDEDPSNGEKFTVRVSNGMEFEVYELAE